MDRRARIKLLVSGLQCGDDGLRENERACHLRVWPGGEEHEPWSRLEHTIVRDERQSESNGGSSDPAIAVVDLAAQRMSDLPATLAQLGAHTNHLVVGLDNGEFSETSFQAAATQLPHPARNAP
jgi:hypothetical protein